MSPAGASSAIKISALVVGGVYLYRRFTEGAAAELKASNKVPPLGQFIVAWSVIYLGLSIAAGPAPAFAGAMALLVMIAVLLSNGNEVSKDLRAALRDPERVTRKKHKGKQGPSKLPSTPATQPETSVA